ncbi:YpmS family protein [Bacillus vallismortis]|uniref:YpmS family protein n=1 Tax=Bacillus vallismortis TaxID=72361 RepID=UPI000EF48D48|nr:YpmS family protein [Bacillus vallismortis]MCI3984893.1 YpmS family protein [Bacillus vallismortis]MCI4138631.1 YpmS family protein [Bacillus vallismortis]MCY7892649.1 YpmS family protein [Bacillus vallismortis]MCY8426432.1 YpmS family protein [Bacillus vallismortis]MCY8534846.1 YpmS family protein [Bacillus vallismortis]
MNKWKRLFFILLAINLILAAGFVTLVMLPGKQAQVKDSTKSEYGFQVTSTKESLAAFVNSYLKDKASNKLDYKVEIDDDVHVAGKIKAFSTSIDALVAFEPTVKKNGDVELNVTKFSLGKLSIPISFVLNYMDSFYELPSFVHVHPGDKSIEVRLSEMPLTNGMYVKADKINLEKDEIEFSYYHPKQ